MELEIGSIVDVVVTDTRPYGLHCAVGRSSEVLVLIPEVSWVASFCSTEQFANVGDSLSVKIINIDEKTGRTAASIRQRFPDPWESGALDVGQMHVARVVRKVEQADRCDQAAGYLLELAPGAFAMFCESKKELIPGQSFNVVITDSNRQNRAVTLAPIGG